MTALHSAPGEDPIIVEGLFDAPVERVYRAWTDPQDFVKWFGIDPDKSSKAELDVRVGGSWRCYFKVSEAEREYMGGEYLTVEPNEKLVFSWSHVVETADGERDATPESRVSVVFEREGDRTRLHLRHEGIQREGARRNVGHGWVETFNHLREIFQTKKGAVA